MAVMIQGLQAMPTEFWVVELEPDVETPGERIQAERLRVGWSQKTLAEKVKAADNAVVSKWEQDKLQPSPAMLDKLERLFEMPPGTLAMVVHRWKLNRERRQDLPGKSIAIPADSDIAQMVQEIDSFEGVDQDALLQAAEEFAEYMRNNPPPPGIATPERRIRDMIEGLAQRYRTGGGTLNANKGSEGGIAIT